MLLYMILLVLIVAYIVKICRMYKEVEHIPGPTPLPFLGNILDTGTRTEDLLVNFQKLIEKYGSVVRLCIGPQKGVLITDPKYIAQILTATEAQEKGKIYDMMKPMIGKGLITSSGKKWYRQRTILNSVFCNSHLKRYVADFDLAANMLVNQLKAKTDVDYVDITDYVFNCTLFAICKAAMQIDITKNEEYYAASNQLTILIIRRFLSPLKAIDFTYQFTEDYRESKRMEAIIDNFVMDVITKRKLEFCRGNGKTLTMLDQLFLQSGKDGFTVEEIRDQVKTFVFAGSDTVGSALSFAIYELAKHPDVQRKILDEVEGVSNDINFEDLSKLKYTECVVKEILRLYSPASFITRLLPTDIHLDDIFIPAGTLAIIFIFGMHRMAKIYPKPDQFDPDRFLPENCRDRPANSFIPFASGPRVCIGQKFAMLEITLMLAKIIRAFEISEHPTHHPILIGSGTLKSSNGLPVKLKLRPSSTQK